MKLNVPFYKQTTPLNCGPVALKMVLDYFGKKVSLEIIEKQTGIREGKGISTIQLAIAAILSGCKVDFYSKHVLFNEENLNKEFYKKYGGMDLEKSKRLVEEARGVGVGVYEKTFSLDDFLKFVTKESIPIVLIDWNVVIVKKEKGYQGHFVPVVGYDEKNVCVHNPGLSGPQEFRSISRAVFDEARKADGTDEDLVIVYKTQSKVL